MASSFAEDLRLARMDEKNLMEEQNTFGRQLREEGFDFQKAIEDRELSEDLRREELRRRKDARDRQEEERTLSRELARRK